MAITSEDIQNQSFSIERKGYDVDEVDVFLERVSDDINELHTKVTELEKKLQEKSAADEEGRAAIMASDEEIFKRDRRIEELEQQLEEKTSNDSAISQALIIAQRTADETIANAEKQSDKIIDDAKKKADQIIVDANADRQEIMDEAKLLDEDCEAMCAQYQDILRDFISNATTKLTEISDLSLKNSLHARKIFDDTDLNFDEDATVATTAVNANDYVVPTTNGTQSAAAIPQGESMDKDLSGFGDASIDGIEIED